MPLFPAYPTTARLECWFGYVFPESRSVAHAVVIHVQPEPFLEATTRRTAALKTLSAVGG
jgi:hypothetical protein